MRRIFALAPEHTLAKLATPEAREAVTAYIATAARKSDVERQERKQAKNWRIYRLSYAINPVNGNKIPIWVADYVLGGYGTGAVMAVPAHDERDHEFATTFELPIIQVIRKT